MHDVILMEQVFPVKVDYNCSIVGMIVLGKYDYVSYDCGQNVINFPVEGSGQEQLDLTLFEFVDRVSSEQVASELEILGYQPATLVELLAFGKEYPEVQKEVSIVALGSVHTFPDSDNYVPVLEGSHVWGGTRGLIASKWGTIWYNQLYKFAAVHK